MRKKYHTLEEMRAAAAERQARWREKNRRTHRERVLEQYGRSKAQGYFKDGVTPEELARLDKQLSGVLEKGPCVTDNATNAKNERRGSEGPGLAMESDADGGRGFEAANEMGDWRAGKVTAADVDAREPDGVSGSSDAGELRYGPIEGWDRASPEQLARMKAYSRRRGGPLMEPEQRGGHGGNKNTGAANERGPGAAGVGGPTAEEGRIKAQLELLQERQASGGLNRRRGVVVEIEA